MTNFTTDQWVILGLVFLLGFLVGAWLTSGGRSKWKRRYNDEVTAHKSLESRHQELEAKHKEREGYWTTREKAWQEEHERREAAVRPAAAPIGHREPHVEDRMRDRDPGDMAAPRRDLDRDGVPDDYDRRPLDNDRR